MSLPNNTHLSVIEFTRLLTLLERARRSIALTPAERVEYDGLAGRASIPVVYPDMPPTIIIPITHETDFICGDPGVGGDEA